MNTRTGDEKASPPAFWRWSALGLVCAIFFVATGGAFSSLGVLFPSIVTELSLSYTQAGAAFTVLALMTGITSTLPAFTLRSGGLPLVYFSGAFIIAGGFAVLSIAQNLTGLLLGAGLVGVGYSQVGAVPAVKLISRLFSERRSLLIGVFFTSGALGSVAGPQLAQAYVALTPSWRGYWVLLAGVIFGLCLVTALFMRSRWVQRASEDAGADETVAGSEVDWTLGEALRTPQYAIIVTGVTITLLGALTMNSFQPTHMQTMGVSAAVAANALSAHGLCNAFSRVLGGALADKIGAKLLFVSGLGAGIIGMGALAFADTPLLIGLFAIGDGYSFGIVTLGSTILLLHYFGAKNNPMILGVLNLVTTLAIVGPILAGNVGDRIGGFQEVFMALAGLMALCTALAVFMPRPVHPSRRV